MCFCSALIVFASCLLSGCGGSGTNSMQQSQAPPPATHFSVAAQPSVTAGVAFSITVTALDASNNVATNYAGTVHFTSSDSQASLPGDQSLTKGTATLHATLFTGGNQSITATDTTISSISGNTGPINVMVRMATHFSVTAPATAVTGSSFNVTVTALDASNNQVGTYSGTVHFTSSDSQASLPGDQSLANGTATLQVTLVTAGNQTITATDTMTKSITGSTTVNVMGVTHFSVNAPAKATAASAFDFTVNALDSSNAVVPAYAGTVHFTSSDSHAVLPPNNMMTSGTATFVAVLKSMGPQTITVTDTVKAFTGTSAPIQVSAAAAVNPMPLIDLPLNPDAVMPGNGGFSLTVNGTGFMPRATVKWNGSARATTFVNKSKLMATILASDVATSNTASVTVTNPGPGGGTSNVVFFEATLPTTGVGFGMSALPPLLSPFGVATADFNRDGKLDLVVGYFSNPFVTVLLGKGGGTFQTPVNYAAGSFASQMAVGDFNGDGKLDLAVADFGTGSCGISILLGNADGTFQAASQNSSVPCDPSSVSVGDFNEDGKPDLVLATNAASVLLGNGDGSFQPVLNYAAGSGTATVAVGDFNGDGHLDLAVANNGSNNVSVLLGNGDGTFQAPLNFPVGNEPYTVVTGDFNGDTILDLAVTNISDGTVSVLLGNGDGTFQGAVNYPAGVNPWGMTAGDFNGDGNLDLAVAGSFTQILFGKGDGTFEPAATYSSQQANPNAVAAGDFTGQGRLDLMVSVTSANSVVELVQSMLAPSRNSVEFPNQVLQTGSTAQDVTLTNVGTQPIDISGIAITGTNAAEFTETDTCGSGLAAGATCAITITFTPMQVGPRTATLGVINSAVGSPQPIALSGIGVVTGPNATLSTNSLTISCSERCRPPFPCFCNCSSVPPGPVTLTDFGKTDLSIASITTATPFSEQNTCDGSVGAGNSCTISVGLGKTLGSTINGTLVISDNAPGSPQMVNLTGNNSCR